MYKQEKSGKTGGKGEGDYQNIKRYSPKTK
jgi:hypothetical protein